MPRSRDPEPLSDEERARLEVQTRRNLDGMTLEHEGRTDEALALYEQNIAEGFEGDWPYGRLVSAYERQGRFEDAERVLRRAMEVTRANRRQPAADRRMVVDGLRGRLRVLKKAAQAARRGAGHTAQKGRSIVSLPMADPNAGTEGEQDVRRDQ
ncbi:MAG: tetratricopeptide repeat protein [Chloroflexi bacterium]|nr:tetratricopeptide repeat protein [Chloroflexota bacterium]